MEYLHHKITEAVCAFRYNPDLNNWDLTKYAEFYNEIRNDGFEKKQEIRPLQLSFQLKPNELPAVQQMNQGEINMVYKNDDDSSAILLGNNYISFHTLNHYPGWEIFHSELISPYIAKYFEIGLGNGLISAQMIYINTFDINYGKNLSDYLNFIPRMENLGTGDELSHLFQSLYDISPNKKLQLKTILNVQPPEKTKKVVFECNCISSNSSTLDVAWETLAKDAHDAAKNAFIKNTTDYFRELIS